MNEPSGISVSGAEPRPAIDLPLIALLWGLTLLVVNPVGDFPLNDDWSWALAVRHLIEHGDFRPPGWTGMPLLTNVLWGSLFCLPAGFSFNALRLSTLVASLLGIFGTYLLMKRLCQPRWLVVAAALTLGFNALYYPLSCTFMTDVLFTALLIFAALFYLRCLQNDSLRDWLIATAISVAGMLSRQLALAVPLGFAAALILRRGFSLRNAALALIPAALCLGTLMGFQHWLAATGRLPDSYFMKTRGLFLVLVSPYQFGPVVARNIYSILMYLGLFLLPVLVLLWPGFWKSRAKTRILFTAALIAIATWTIMREAPDQRTLMPVASGILEGWGIGPAALRDVFILRLDHKPALPAGLWMAVTMLSLLGAALLIMAVGLIVIERARKLWPGRMNDREAASAFLLCTAIVYLLPILLDDDSYDRYFMPAIPFFAAGIAGAFPGVQAAATKHWRAAAAVLLVCFALFTMLTTRDYLAWNRVRWQALRDLMAASHVGPDDIDGGFEFNGWYEYDPDYRHSPGKSWWWVRRETYQIGFGPVPDYSIIREYPYREWLPPRLGKIVVLKQDAPASGAN